MGRNRKQSRLLEKVRQLESLESILRDYRELKLRECDAKYAAAADNAAFALLRPEQSGGRRLWRRRSLPPWSRKRS